MHLPFQAWATIHPSAYRDAATPVRRIPATLRPHGGLRYQCPVNGSFILVTDDATLDRLGRAPGRLRCMDCGELHLLSQD